MLFKLIIQPSLPNEERVRYLPIIKKFNDILELFINLISPPPEAKKSYKPPLQQLFAMIIQLLEFIDKPDPEWP